MVKNLLYFTLNKYKYIRKNTKDRNITRTTDYPFSFLDFFYIFISLQKFMFMEYCFHFFFLCKVENSKVITDTHILQKKRKKIWNKKWDKEMVKRKSFFFSSISFVCCIFMFLASNDLTKHFYHNRLFLTLPCAFHF